LSEPLREALEALALRASIATRLEPPGGEAVLRSVVEAVVALFSAQASSIAIHDPRRDVLVFRHAAGPVGAGAVGLEIPTSAGIAGYVFSTAQPLAVHDAAADPRFDLVAAESSGYVPRQILAVPLTDDDGTIGVLEIIDRRDGARFDLRDIELASVFARQAAVAIRAARVERDVTELFRATVARLAPDLDAARIREAIADAVRTVDADGDDGLWALVDAVAAVREAAPDQLALVGEILGALARHSGPDARHGRLGRP